MAGKSTWLAAGALLAVIPAAPVQAQGAPVTDAPTATATATATGQDQIIVTGSRFGGRTATDSATPIDAISRDMLQQSGRVDLIQQLKVAVPSFNTPRPLGSGVGDYLLPPSLRGLGPGEVLVLVGGKRRHTSSDLNASNGIGRGDVSVDFNAIPAFALDRAEVLRDGASAQYGSDAISGVINLILDRSIGTRGQVTGGITTAGDGAYAEASVSSGIRVGTDGALRLTASIQTGAGTNRARRDTRQQYFGTDAAGRPVAISGNYGSGTGLTPSNGTLDPREATIDRNVFRFGDQPSTNRQVFANFIAPPRRPSRSTRSAATTGWTAISNISSAAPDRTRRCAPSTPTAIVRASTPGSRTCRSRAGFGGGIWPGSAGISRPCTASARRTSTTTTAST